MFRRFKLVACAILFSVLAANAATAQALHNWPQWQGPTRNGLMNETGLMKSWPEDGPRRLWLFEKCGLGYGTPAIVDGRLFIMGARDGNDYLICLELENGKELWATSTGPALENDWGDGSRGTPAISDGQVYILTGNGTLFCARADNGNEVWRTSMRDLGTPEPPYWGFTESVLVDGNRVLCTPGGERGAVAAFDKATGRLLWRSTEVKDAAHYPSMVRGEFYGKPQYVQLFETRMVGLSVDDGRLLWEHYFPGDTAVIPTPIVHENYVYATAGYGIGCMLVEVAKDNTASEVYLNKVMKNHHGGAIRIGEWVYGHSDGTGWVCMNFLTGELKWRERTALGKGAVGYADGMLYCLSEEEGEVVLIESSPEGWKEHGRFTLSPQSKIRSDQGMIWTHPVIIDGKLFLRDQELLFCFNVKAAPEAKTQSTSKDN